METTPTSPGSSAGGCAPIAKRLGVRKLVTTTARIALASLLVMLLGGNAMARPIETALLPGLSIRNGDWVAVDGLGVVLLGSPEPGGYAAPAGFIAVVMRGELGIGGVSAGFGLATNALSGPCPSQPRWCEMSTFMGSGMLSLEARVERMYGLTGWRHTTYVGGQLSLSFIVFKPALGWMVAADDPRDGHLQLATGLGW